MRKSKALDWVLEHAEVVDEAGNAIDTDMLLGKDQHDHDHTPADQSIGRRAGVLARAA